MAVSNHTFLGVRIDNTTMKSVLAHVDEAISHKKKLAIATVNPELIMLARSNAKFKQVLNKANLVTPDGISLVVIGALTGRNLRERVTGADLCNELAREAAEKGWRIYLLGAAPGVAQKAADNLFAKYPHLTICGADDTDPVPELANQTVTRIKESKADILLVAYGSPAQELWLDSYGDKTSALVTIGVGGSFDFIAGTVKRAPAFIRRIGLEWLWRLIIQPWRWRRMLALPIFGILTLLEVFRRK